jgi:hypothetical protein
VKTAAASWAESPVTGCGSTARKTESAPLSPSIVLVSSAARSVAVWVARPGPMTASFMSAGSGRLLTARTWTRPTVPTSIGSVPGLARRASAEPGSGPCSGS